MKPHPHNASLFADVGEDDRLRNGAQHKNSGKKLPSKVEWDTHHRTGRIYKQVKQADDLSRDDCELTFASSLTGCVRRVLHLCDQRRRGGCVLHQNGKEDARAL